MPDEIQPALTPDEWASMLADDEFPDGLLPPLVRIQSVRDENAVGDYLFKMAATFNAALPDDDPRKITREDVDTLRTMVVHDHEGFPIEGPPDPFLSSLAAKLAALLPPE